jgi:lysophospholipase L1-like esterase
LIVAPLSTTLYFVNKVTTEYKEESYKEVFKLHNKKILSFGDSLADGGANDGVSYAHLIAENNNMRLLSKAVGGATMRVVSGSVNNVGVQVDSAIAENSTRATVDFDFILLEGGTNDVNSGTLGDIIDGYDVSTCDNTTFTGALEINISKIRNAWWGANIIYILAHKMSSRNTEKQKQFHDRIIEVCNKWSIPYVDIYNNGQITSYIDVIYTNCFPDGDYTHPNITGYEKFYVPPITAKMKELNR